MNARSRRPRSRSSSPRPLCRRPRTRAAGSGSSRSSATGGAVPVGVDPGGVRFSWVMESDARGQSQGAYRLQVASSREALLAGQPDVWDSRRVGGRDSLSCPTPARRSSRRGPILSRPGRRRGEAAHRLELAGGLRHRPRQCRRLGEARWIGYEDMPERERLVPGLHGLLDPQVRPKLKPPVVPAAAPRVRGAPARRAGAALRLRPRHPRGLSERREGRRSVLAPGWTDYRTTVLYDAHDVTDRCVSARTRSRRWSETASTTIERTLRQVRDRSATRSSSASASSTRTVRETITTGPAWKARRSRSSSPASTAARTTTPARARRAGTRRLRRHGLGPAPRRRRPRRAALVARTPPDTGHGELRR